MPSHLTIGPETLAHLFEQLTLDHATNQNLQRIIRNFPHRTVLHKHQNRTNHRHHHATVLHAMALHFNTDQIADVLTNYKMAEVTEESVYADFFNSDIPHHPIVRDDHYDLALAITTDTFRPDSKVRPAHMLDIRDHYPINPSTNPEVPFSTNPTFLSTLPPGTKPTTGNMLHTIVDSVRKWHHEIKHHEATFDKYLFYMLLHVKTTVIKAEDPNKLRTIWGVPKPWIYAQLMFHWALFATYRRNSKRYPLLWGYETILGGWFRLNNELMHHLVRSSYLMIDWKRFDKYVPHEGIDDIHHMTESYIDFDNGYLPTLDYPDTQSTWSPAKADRLRTLYHWTNYAYHHTPILLPDGSLYKRRHATLPSGLYTTQYYDSTWNYLMLCTILLSLGFDPRHCIIKVLGDDSLIKLATLIPASAHDDFFLALQDKATHYFGSIISLNKSKVSNSIMDTEVLGYRNLHGLPRRSTSELLAKLYFSKSRNPTPSISMGMAIGIAYANLGMDTRLHATCENIFRYYESAGHTPSRSGLTSVIGSDPFSSSSHELTFPSIRDVQSQLMNSSYLNESTYAQFFPRSWFLADA
jgi:hypothetical protein